MLHSHERVRHQRSPRCCSARGHRRTGQWQLPCGTQLRRINETQTSFLEPHECDFATAHAENLRELHTSSLWAWRVGNHSFEVGDTRFGRLGCDTLSIDGLHRMAYEPSPLSCGLRQLFDKLLRYFCSLRLGRAATPKRVLIFVPKSIFSRREPSSSTGIRAIVETSFVTSTVRLTRSAPGICRPVTQLLEFLF